MKKTSRTLKYLAIFGNLIFILWISYNGINEGFNGTVIEIISYIVLIALLILNTVLLCRKNNSSSKK